RSAPSSTNSSWGGDIALVGERTNPLPYVAAADLFVLTSRNEGLPVALLEAMGLGTPIVSTDALSGPRYALQDGRGGLITPVGDAAALASAIDRMLGDPTLSGRLAAISRKRADDFSPAHVATQYLDLADALQ
ncbi:MAG TPA: glycosyltransferase, partial [Euzebya sp.]|nr:glycosyltransferase [Euzebya sp.]